MSKRDKKSDNSIVVVGSVAYDSIITPYGARKRALGGSATYFSISASYFAPVRLIGVVGKDFSSEHFKLLEKRGIDLAGLEIRDGKTFFWEGEYKKENINDAITIGTHLNVFESFDPAVIPEHLKTSEYLFLANIDPGLQLNVLDRIGKKHLVVCDTMNLWIDLKREGLFKLLKKVDVFILNENEARLLTGESVLSYTMEKLSDLGPDRIIIKKGEDGCVYFNGENYFFVPSYPVKHLKDPTGAGDTFAGGFLGYCALNNADNEKIFRQAVIYGSVMASFVIEGFSVSPLLRLSKKDIENRYKKFIELSHV